MKPFIPHEFKSEMLVECTPTILISHVAYEKMYHCVNCCNDEISWLGSVEKLDGDMFLIEDIFILKQEVSMAHTSMDEEALANFAKELLKQPNGDELFNKTRFWGHSHVEMDTEPSGQDDKQMEFFKEVKCDYFIRGIFNKEGSAKFDLFYYDKMISVQDVPWMLYPNIGETAEKFIKGEIRRKVKKSKINHNYSFLRNNRLDDGGMIDPEEYMRQYQESNYDIPMIEAKKRKNGKQPKARKHILSK